MTIACADTLVRLDDKDALPVTYERVGETVLRTVGPRLGLAPATLSVSRRHAQNGVNVLDQFVKKL